MTDITSWLPEGTEEPSPAPAPTIDTEQAVQEVVTEIPQQPTSVTNSALSMFGIDTSASEQPPTYPTPASPAPVQQTQNSVVTGALSSFGIETEAPAPLPGAPIQTAYGTINAPEFEGQASSEFVAAFENNALPSWEADPEQLRRISAFTAQLWHYGKAAGDQDMIDAAAAFRARADGIIPDEILAEYGLDMVPLPEGPGGFLGGVMQIGESVPGTWLERFGGAVGVPLLNFMDSASQGFLTGIGTVWANPTQSRAWWTGAQAFTQGVTYGGIGNAMEELGLVDEHDEQGILKAAREKLDNDGDGSLNWREVQGKDAETGGRWLGLLDTIMVGIFDPLTWVGLGPAARARAGLTAVAATQGDDVARAVQRSGLTAVLDERAIREVDIYMRNAVELSQSTRRQGLWSRLGISDNSVQAQVDRQLNALQGPVGMFSYAGYNVRIPMFDSAVYRLRPGFGTGTSRMAAETRDIFDPEVDADLTLDAARTMISAVDEVIELTDDEVAARVAAGLAGGSASSGARLVGEVFDYDGNLHARISRTITDDRYAEMAVEVYEGADPQRVTANIINDAKALEAQGFHSIRVNAPGESPVFWSERGFVPDTTRSEPIRAWLDEAGARIDDVLAQIDDDLTDALPGQGQLSLGDVGVEALIPPNQQRVILEELRDRIRAAYDAPTVSNLVRVANPDNRVGWDELGRIIGGFDEFPPLPLVRGLGAADALRVLQGGGRRFGQRVAATRAGRRFGRAFRPRSDLQVDLDDYAEQAFDAARISMDTGLSIRMNDLLRRLESVANKAAKAEGTLDDADRIIRNEVLEAPEGFGMSAYDSAMWQVDNVIRKQYSDELADYAATVVQVRKEIDDLARKNGLETLRESYFPRTLTVAGREAILENPNADEALKKLGLDPSKIRGHEGRFHNPRSFMPDATLDEANRELARLLDLPPDAKLFEDNVLAAFATRGYAAYKAAGQLEGLQQLTKEFVTIDGRRMSMVMDLKPGMRVPDGYRTLNDIDSGRFVALREVADEIESFYRILTNDKAMRELHKNIDRWAQTWGMYATAPLIDGFGFHSRNFAGNIILNATAGIGPHWYPRAMKVQVELAGVFKLMKEEGLSFEAAMDKLQISDVDRTLFKALRDNDVINSGWFDDMVRDTDDATRPRAAIDSDKTPLPRFLNTYDNSWDFLQNNTMIRTGRAVGSAIESNARIAHFMARIGAGDTPQQAARSMRKYLFDYGDLTEVERRLRMASRFYTFMRKNASVQLWALTRYPGRVHSIQRAWTGGDPGAGIMGFGFGGIPGQQDWSRERGDNIPLIGGLIGGVETPFQAFAESFWTPLMTFGSMVSGDVDRKEFLSSMLALTSGGPRSVFDNLMIDIAKYNPAFNREATEREKGKENTAVRWIESMTGPFYSQMERLIQRVSNTEGVGPIGNDPSQTVTENNWAVLLFSNILGMNVARVDTPDETERDILWMLDQELRDILDHLRDQGEAVPTIDDLRKLGIIPEVERGAARASSVVTQETIDRLEESGLDIDLMPLYAELDERLASEAERGVIIEEDGTYTDRIGRLRAFSAANGVLTEGGNGSTSTAMKVLWNQQNPNDPFINPDTGQPYNEYDVPVRWDDVSEDQVLAWAREVGAPLTRRGNVGQKTQEAWNAAFPDNPYYGEWGTEQKLEAGVRPLQGILVWTAPDGTEREYGPRTPLSEVLFGN